MTAPDTADAAKSASALRIVIAAERLFARRGIDGVSLRQISVEAGSSNNSAVHYYFGSKEGLIGAIFRHRLPQLLSERRLLAARCDPGDLRSRFEAHYLPVLNLAEASDNHYISFVEQLNEVTLHFAVYCGWPRASQLEQCVREQWHRVHQERGEETPAFPKRDVEDLGPADRAERIAGGVRSFEEINLVSAPSQDSPYFYAGILNYVFGHVWLRPGLTVRERRLVTIPCVGVSDAANPIWSHVTSALGSGDVSYEEMLELILHVSAYAGAPRAQRLQDVAVGWQASRS